jgi:tyrosyl-tRNA synthetase
MEEHVFEELRWRGLIYDHVEGVDELLRRQKITIYNGFDATADSLHVGHLVPLIALARLQRYGHHPIALAGGGTSMIGDPSGKAAERSLLTLDQVVANVEKIKGQLAHLLDFEVKTNPARVMNNADWLLSLNLVEFLRDIGKHFTVNYMISKDSVSARLERESGISFTEFSYMLLQAYDFLYLHDHFGCLLQTGGSDQWGNITAGVELVRRVHGTPVYGLVYPLITKADGTKFGKTETGTVWLDAQRTSPYRFYQFWVNTSDKDVIPYLKFFTFLERREVEELEYAVQTQPEQRQAQLRLAQVMTETLHGRTALSRAEQASQALFGGEISGLSAEEIQDIFAEVPSSEFRKEALVGGKMNILELLTASGVTKSRGEARRLIAEGGAYLNNRRVSSPDEQVNGEQLLEGRFLVLRKGRKSYHLVRVRE